MKVPLGLLHPGAMGSALGAALTARGHRVLWCSAGRSQATRERADAAGLEAKKTLSGLLQAAPIVLCVCPPHTAEAQAEQVAALGYGGLYVDANAISPQRGARVAAIVEGAGARAVDGGIIGPPPAESGTTRLYLSGSAAGEVAELFKDTLIQACVLEGEPRSASALKMAYAAHSKGSLALVALARAVATRHGVDSDLLAEWARAPSSARLTGPELLGRGAAVAWRWSGEMEEIADTCREAGLPDGMHRGAADVYRRWDHHRDQYGEDPQALLKELLEGSQD